jgi:hypothetical protein
MLRLLCFLLRKYHKSETTCIPVVHKEVWRPKKFGMDPKRKGNLGLTLKGSLTRVFQLQAFFTNQFPGPLLGSLLHP